MSRTQRATAAQDTWEAVTAAMDILAAQEDDEIDSEQQYVPAEEYFRPSRHRAAQELDLLMAIYGQTPLMPEDAGQCQAWLDEVAQELDWIRQHPPLWSMAPRCLDCGREEPIGNGPPRNDGRPRTGELIATFRAGVGPAHRCRDGCTVR